MIVDCDSCEVRGNACGDCVIGVLLGAPSPCALPYPAADTPFGAPLVQLDAPERRALDVLAEQGLVPKLRLVAPRARRASIAADRTEEGRHAG